MKYGRERRSKVTLLVLHFTKKEHLERKVQNDADLFKFRRNNKTFYKWLICLVWLYSKKVLISHSPDIVNAYVAEYNSDRFPRDSD